MFQLIQLMVLPWWFSESTHLIVSSGEYQLNDIKWRIPTEGEYQLREISWSVLTREW